VHGDAQRLELRAKRTVGGAQHGARERAAGAGMLQQRLQPELAAAVSEVVGEHH
jgi:hypothetical protein